MQFQQTQLSEQFISANLICFALVLGLALSPTLILYEDFKLADISLEEKMFLSVMFSQSLIDPCRDMSTQNGTFGYLCVKMIFFHADVTLLGYCQLQVSQPLLLMSFQIMYCTNIIHVCSIQITKLKKGPIIKNSKTLIVCISHSSGSTSSGQGSRPLLTAWQHRG